MNKILALGASLFAVVLLFTQKASAALSTSTVDSMVTANMSTAWDYISSALTTLIPFGIGIAVLFGAIYFVLRRVHLIK